MHGVCVIMIILTSWSLLTWGDDEGDHAGPISSSCLQGLDQLLDFPDFNILVGVLRILTHVDSGVLVAVG